MTVIYGLVFGFLLAFYGIKRDIELIDLFIIFLSSMLYGVLFALRSI